MANRGLGYALMGLTGLAQGYMGQKEKNRLAEQQEQENALKRGALDLQNRKTGIDIDKITADMMNEGLTRDESGGGFRPDPTFFDETSDNYKRMEQAAKFKQKQTAAGQAPRMNFAQAYAVMGKPVPSGVDPNAMMPDSVAASLTKPQGPSITYGDQDIASLATATGLSPEAVKASVGSPAGRGVMNTAATGVNRNAIQSRSDRNYEQGVKNFDTTKDLQVATATKADIEAITGIDQDIARLNQIAKDAPAFKPSGIEYRALRAKAAANTYDPGTFIRGKPYLVNPLTPEEQARLSWYAGLSADSINNMFERGGKTLTAEEKKATGELSISPSDSTEQIIAKIPRIGELLQKKRAQKQSVIDYVSGARSGEPVDRSKLYNKPPKAPTADAVDTRASMEATMNANKKAVSAYPKPGDVRKGYRYKGGKPDDKKNWEKVK